MRLIISFFLTFFLFVLVGCSYNERPNTKLQSADAKLDAYLPSGRPAATVQQANQAAGGGSGGGRQAGEEKILAASFANPGAAQAAAIDRKIIRDAELAIELDSPTEGQRRITAIAEAHGGFVVTSEFKQNEGSGQSASHATVSVIVRVPAMQFAAVVQQIESLSGRVRQRKVTGQDVTEEYIDLEARIRTKRALEAQFLEIMKQARKVSDALEVQSQLADVRTEIERLEGRRRFLENQSALSTITITLQMPAPVVAATTSGFFQNVKEAAGESIDLATNIILGLIRIVIVLTPVLLLIVLPAVLLWRFFNRRWFKQPPVAENE